MGVEPMAVFDSLDKNGDGVIDRSEWLRATQLPAGAQSPGSDLGGGGSPARYSNSVSPKPTRYNGSVSPPRPEVVAALETLRGGHRPNGAVVSEVTTAVEGSIWH